VESPTKAVSLGKILGPGYVVESSRGHIRDLPTAAAEVPAKYKGEKWARTGVNVDAGFMPVYVVPAEKRATLRDLKAKLSEADELFLATDEDREGEAIAWHLLDELKPKIPVKRMVFHEITEEAIRDAVEKTRELDTDLVDAQETRRILDRLYGYEVSPVLWKKVMPKLSAGRVQSVATRLLVDRERERIAFQPADYADVEAVLGAGENAEPPTFTAKVIAVSTNRIATGRDFDSTGKLLKPELLQLDLAAARKLAEALGDASFAVTSVESKAYSRRPYAPFRTTTLQQEAGRKLGFTAQRTMSVAQELYERGFITYMRTDSVTLSNTATTLARKKVKELFGGQYLPERPRAYTSKVKNAQEAHEAIRPAGDFQAPNQTGLSGDQYRLYELVWKRTLASQMKDAEGQTISVKIGATLPQRLSLELGEKSIDAGRATLAASGRTITFAGFLAAYVESVDDDQSTDDEQARLPVLVDGQRLTGESFTPSAHQTRPPSRYTEPSLVAKLEELEIGRPSTYAAIIRTITARDYVFKKGQALVPTWLAFAVTRLLEEHFSKLVDYKFTAQMEEDLDEVANGNAARLAVLTDFYFEDGGLQALVSDLGDIDARKLSTFPIADGIDLRVGRYGTNVEDSEGHRASVDPELPPDELTGQYARELLDRPADPERPVGTDPKTGYAIVAKDGRYGPYVIQVLPEDAPKSAKPKTASLFKSMSVESVTLDQATALLSLPRVLGKDADGEEITAQNGRYGPYLKKGSDSRSLETEEQIFSITLEQAQAIYAQPKVRGRSAAAGPLRELGSDPATGNPVVVKDGRFGPYVTDGQTNATLRRTDSVAELTLERAAELLADKRAQPPRAAPKRRASAGSRAKKK
jgi:DNA topoisomerase-1